MKTTLNLNDQVLRQARERAARDGITLTRFVEDALRARLADTRGQKRDFRLRLTTVTRGCATPTSTSRIATRFMRWSTACDRRRHQHPDLYSVVARPNCVTRRLSPHPLGPKGVERRTLSPSSASRNSRGWCRILVCSTPAFRGWHKRRCRQGRAEPWPRKRSERIELSPRVRRALAAAVRCSTGMAGGRGRSGESSLLRRGP